MVKDLYDIIAEILGTDPTVTLLLAGLVTVQILNYQSQRKLGEIVTAWDKAFTVHQETTDLKLDRVTDDIYEHGKRLDRHSKRLNEHHDIIVRLTEKTDHSR